jgi:hypothetical protein
MSEDGYRVLLDCRQRSATLRAKGFTYDQLADAFALDHEVSPLRLHRYAHGLTGAEAVSAYNDLDPAGTAALREPRLYVFEGWPDSERRPTARALLIFSRVYQTTARRLVTDQVYRSYLPSDRDLIDRADHRHLDPHYSQRPICSHHSDNSRHDSGQATPRVSMEPAPAGGGRVLAATPWNCAALLRAVAAEEADVKRRDLLLELALALGGAPAVALLRHLSPPEKEQLVAAVRASSRVDAGTVAVIEKLTAQCRRLDDDFGPGTVLPIVERQRNLVTDLLHRHSLLPGLRDRLTSTYAELSQFAGYLHHDLMDHDGACLRYQEALTAAHEISDPTLIVYLHTCLSMVALYQGSLGQAHDHIFAGQGWARQSPSNLMRSVHAMDLARILARGGRTRDSEQAFAQSLHLAELSRTEADPSYLYWWAPDQVQGCASECMLAWGRPGEAIDLAEQALSVPTTRKLLRGQTLLVFAEALTRTREIPTAADKIRDAAHLTTQHSSVRLVDSVRQARARLQPWAGNKHIRALDEELHSLGIPTTSPSQAVTRR